MPNGSQKRCILLIGLVGALGACDEPTARVEPETDARRQAVLDRLTSETGNLIGGREVYDCFSQRVQRDMSLLRVLQSVEDYYQFRDAGRIPPPAEISRLEGSVLVALDYIRRCQPTPLRSLQELGGKND